MPPAGKSLRCVSSALVCGLLGGPSFLRLIVAFPGGRRTSRAFAEATTGGGHGAVGVNDGLLVAGSVHIGVEPVPNLCVALRGYKAGEGPEQECGFRDGRTNTPAMARCSSSGSWWGPSEAPPKFRQMQRTSDPGGSFAFVTPESGMSLILAAFSHGGDYPTTVRFLRQSKDDGLTAAEQRRRHVTPGVESGRLDVRINISERTNMAELLWWSASARENDHSPCALESAFAADDGSAIWGGTRVGPLLASSSELQSVPDWMSIHDPTGGNAPHGGVNRLPIARDGLDGRETPTGLQQLAALLRSSCLHYGQQSAGLWEANAAVCAICAFAPEAEQAHDNINIGQNLVVIMEHAKCNMGILGVAEGAIAFGVIFFLLCKLLLCFFGVSSSTQDGYDHITQEGYDRIAEDGYSHIGSASGDLKGINDTTSGAHDSPVGGMSQLAIAAPGHLIDSDTMSGNRRSDARGRPKRVVTNATDGTDDFDAFSSMFSTLDDVLPQSVESWELGSVGPPRSWVRDNYVVFEQ